MARNAATATDRASLGSLLPVFSVCSNRTRAASLGCTSTTRSPAATSCWASRRPSPGAPSTAQVRSGQAAAQATSCPAWAGQARIRTLPSGSSAAVTATAVCEPLCGSIPIITVISELHLLTRRLDRPRRACLIPDLRAGRSSLFRATPRQGPTGQAHRSEARHTGRQAVREPAPSDLSRRYVNRSAQSGGLYKAGRRAVSGAC